MNVKALVTCFLVLTFSCSQSVARVSPNLVISQDDIPLMQSAIKEPGSFAKAYLETKASVDEQISQTIKVPVPKDGGGGPTHERHKKNYLLMYNAGVIYQLSEDKKYANYVRDMLLEYAKLYPTLDVHPKRKLNKQNPGKLFWQSLNEAMWLVHTIQAYDLILDSLSADEIATIESKLLKPVSLFLSEGQPSTFNKVHNHGTWAAAGVGMAGYVLNEPEYVEKALLDLEKSGKGGFLRQLDELFSPEGYYNEGPYYQRFALLPFITFAKAIQNNQPERKIFEHRNGIIIKAIDTTIQLSYNKLFYPINDAIKSKGIDTIELVNGVTVAYGFTQDTGLLDIAKQQGQIILTGDGLKVANALDANLATPYKFKSVAFGDGANGKQGALVIMRQESRGEQALLFKPAAQGLGHGHFDKLTWQFYDNGAEIVSDYGAARFLNVEAKFGGRYLPENDSYAKQTVAHNTVVVDEKSHFLGDVEVGNANHPELLFFENNAQGSVSSAQIDTAYKGVNLLRTLALVKLPEIDKPLAFDIFEVTSEEVHQLDLPVHYHGHFIDSNFTMAGFGNNLKALGNNNGYQHLWLTGQATPKAGIAQITWLNDNGRFYTQSSLVDGSTDALFTRVGANDPNFNLRNESGFIYRKNAVKNHRFVSVLEPHGEYNPSKEYTLSANPKVSNLSFEQVNNISLVTVQLKNGAQYLLAINNNTSEKSTFKYQQVEYKFNGRFNLFKLPSQK
ncbi:alginate lyase family protein [Thalassomonas sp. M1454]|nr:alginate lyase family protein [Thalassomonas sp. M1454]